MQLYLKRPPQITLLYLKKKVKRKATILCVFIVYSITKKKFESKEKAYYSIVVGRYWVDKEIKKEILHFTIINFHGGLRR